MIIAENFRLPFLNYLFRSTQCSMPDAKPYPFPHLSVFEGFRLPISIIPNLPHLRIPTSEFQHLSPDGDLQQVLPGFHILDRYLN